jgi:hypothetical protein
MLMIFSDVETLDHRCADRAQLLHDDQVPLLPARREPGPRRSLNVSDLIGARHRPSRYRCIHRTRRHSLVAVHNALMEGGMHVVAAGVEAYRPTRFILLIRVHGGVPSNLDGGRRFVPRSHVALAKLS